LSYCFGTRWDKDRIQHFVRSGSWLGISELILVVCLFGLHARLLFIVGILDSAVFQNSKIRMILLFFMKRKVEIVAHSVDCAVKYESFDVSEVMVHLRFP
jgi:hypothetical protein